MATNTETIKVTIYDLGYSKTLTKDDDFYTENAQVVSKITSGIASANVLGGDSVGNQTMTDGMYQSSNYIYGVSGWRLEPDNAYFWNVIISGTLVSSNIHIPDENTTANSFHVESDGDTWWGCTQTNFTANNENAAAYILKTGVVKFNSGKIAGWSLSSAAIYLNGATDILSSGMAPDDFPFYAGKKYADRATAPFRVTPAGELTATSAIITGAITAATGSVIATSYLSGAVALSNTNIAAMGWTSTIVFSATDYRIITWAAGVLTTAAGTSYNILTGNTGNMATTTYIYLDIAVSTTALQVTTTATTANGSGKILIAVANPNSDTTSKATLQAFGGIGGQILMVDNIVANSASTNIFITNSAQIADAMITNAKVVSLDVGKLTAGDITSKAINLVVAAGTGDSYIAAGKTDFNNTQNGFILGIDDSDSDLAKFFIGSTTQYFNWTGTAMNLYGVTLTSGIIQTAVSGQRIVLNSTGMIGYDGNDNINYYINSSDNPGTLMNLVSSSNQVGFQYIQLSKNESHSVPQLYLYSSPIVDNGGSYTESAYGIQIRSELGTVTPTVPRKTGAGTLTLTSSGNFLEATSKNYVIEIDGAGNPNTFKWSDNGGSSWNATGVAITGSNQLLSSGISIKFNATTGGVVGDTWIFETGAISGYNRYLIDLENTVTTSTGTMIRIQNDGLGYDISGTNDKWNVKPDGTIFGQELQADGDIGGLAGTNALTGVSDISANSTGVGSIKLKGTTSRDSAGFIKVYIGTTPYYVPAFSAITG